MSHLHKYSMFSLHSQGYTDRINRKEAFLSSKADAAADSD